MNIPLWEWDVTDGTSCGVARTLHGAMESLSRALVKSGKCASGHVVPVTLVDGAQAPFYLHGLPERTAEQCNGVITWHAWNA